MYPIKRPTTPWSNALEFDSVAATSAESAVLPDGWEWLQTDEQGFPLSQAQVDSQTEVFKGFEIKTSEFSSVRLKGVSLEEAVKDAESQGLKGSIVNINESPGTIYPHGTNTRDNRVKSLTVLRVI